MPAYSPSRRSPPGVFRRAVNVQAMSPAFVTRQRNDDAFPTHWNAGDVIKQLKPIKPLLHLHQCFRRRRMARAFLTVRPGVTPLVIAAARALLIPCFLKARYCFGFLIDTYFLGPGISKT